MKICYTPDTGSRKFNYWWPGGDHQYGDDGTIVERKGVYYEVYEGGTYTSPGEVFVYRRHRKLEPTSTRDLPLNPGTSPVCREIETYFRAITRLLQ